MREVARGRTMIDRIDAKLLDLLQRTGPRPAAELGDIVGLSASACHRRIRALEAAGIITGYTARLDPESIGLGLDVFVDISLTSQSEEALTAFEQIGRAHGRTPVTNAHLVCRLLLEKKK